MGTPRRVPATPSGLSDDDALYGAATRVVFELVGNPYNCATPEQLVVLSAAIAEVREWSRAQEPDVARAYERAAVHVLGEAKTMVENTLRSQRMLALYATIPRPPVT